MSDAFQEADVIVIGAGACGLAAAVTAAEAGSRIAVFEKQRSLGGTSNFFEGTFAVESAMQREKYITYSRDEAFRRMMEYSHWRANARLVRTFVDESAATITWLQGLGVEFPEVATNMPNGFRTYHIVKGRGAAVVKALASRAKELGVVMRLGTPVTRILNEGNRITGVAADGDGEEMTAAAPAVIIATGGYANNKAWVKKYAGFDIDTNVIPIGNVDKMGDGIRMAWEAGAAEEGMGTLETYRFGPMGTEFRTYGPVQMVALQPDLWVDPKGDRFCDEGIAFYDTSVGNVNMRYKEGFTYCLFDDSIKDYYAGHGIHRNVGWKNVPGTTPVGFDEEMNGAISKGSAEVCAATSVEELAVQMNVEPAVLKETIAEYNRFCEKGHDDLFAKDRRYLRSLRGPRFYAAKARTVLLVTLGGIRINHRMEVLDKKDKRIPGLYAGGMDVGGMWGDSYPIQDSTGASSAFAINSGRIAARQALEYLRTRGQGRK
jgi:fumarate reductase flavoprotein subunit